jgi:glutaredoxin-like protein
MECQFCEQTHELLSEVAELSDKLTLEVYDFVNDKEKVLQYGVDKIPATIVEGEKDYGIRFFGVPSGYEFSTLLSSIQEVSSKESGLSERTKGLLENIHTPMHIQVFITPTCPYCPGAVSLAHKLALECDAITGDMVEAMEFPHLAQKYGVMGVPKIIVNDDIEFEGALPEEMFVDQLMMALKG